MVQSILLPISFTFLSWTPFCAECVVIWLAMTTDKGSCCHNWLLTDPVCVCVCVCVCSRVCVCHRVFVCMHMFVATAEPVQIPSNHIHCGSSYRPHPMESQLVTNRPWVGGCVTVCVCVCVCHSVFICMRMHVCSYWSKYHPIMVLVRMLVGIYSEFLLASSLLSDATALGPQDSNYIIQLSEVECRCSL